MRAINATPKTIRQIFSESYIIPEFQRPYSWGTEQCDKLFEDITEFFNSSAGDGSYYLGSLVIYKEEGKWSVIDGQQRLTTLMLFLTALWNFTKIEVLEQCIKETDSLTGKMTDELRLVSYVFEKDREEFENVIFFDKASGTRRFKKNYDRFYVQLHEFFQGKTINDVNDFTRAILDRIVILPIECESMDDALTIFDTVNDRGMPLSDADIFKAKLFKEAKERAGDAGTDEFMKRWNALLENGDVVRIFRCLMHIKRAENGDIGGEMKLRAYFDKNRQIFQNWRDALTALEKISYIYWYEKNAAPEFPEAGNMWRILDYLPNEYWFYPIITFWFKYAEEQGDIWMLSKEKQAAIRQLFWETLRYYYLNAVAYNNVGRVKKTTYLVCKAIWSGEDYISIYTDNSGKAGEALRLFEDNVKNYYYTRAWSGLVLLTSFLNPHQNQKKLAETVSFEVEHILPRNGAYAAYNGWTEEECEEKLDTLGNYVALEKAKNITAKNYFFQKKQKSYEESAYQDARDLCKLDDWTYAEWQKREQEVEARLFKFFGIKPKDAQSAE